MQELSCVIKTNNNLKIYDLKVIDRFYIYYEKIFFNLLTLLVFVCLTHPKKQGNVNSDLENFTFRPLEQQISRIPFVFKFAVSCCT